jgi:hypothetical protein
MISDGVEYKVDFELPNHVVVPGIYEVDTTYAGIGFIGVSLHESKDGQPVFWMATIIQARAVDQKLPETTKDLAAIEALERSIQQKKQGSSK